ncbi:MAG: hypothetical protein KatS3mg108_2792 [Isosphaeraceae bacterium]|nr:MAG: hypothetical protein KatS3mg108_2792 [Isosphaeraceae bacterium]
MPVLRRSENPPGLIIEALPNEPDGRYSLSEQGERFLASVLGLHPGDTIRDKDLALMIDRGWATKLPPTTPQPPPHTPHSSPRGESPNPRPAASRRSRGREVALQVLYLSEQNPEVDPQEIERFLARRLRDPKLIDYTRSLVEGVRSHLAQIDERIASVAENWRLDRMAAIDRNILRLGVYEMHYRDDIPVKVAINEALELAKRYSTAQSSRFVNGILDRLQSTPESETSPSTTTSPPPPEPEPTSSPPAPIPPPEPANPPSRPGSPPLASRGVAGRASSALTSSASEPRPNLPPHEPSQHNPDPPPADSPGSSPKADPPPSASP